MKKSNSILAMLLCAVLLLSACSNTKVDPITPPTTGGEKAPKVEPVSNVNTLYSSEWPELNYLTSSNGAVSNAFALLIDGQVQYDVYGQPVPCAAKSWKVSDDGLTWTFNMREDLKWFDHTGKEVADVVADDFLAGMQYVLTPANKSRTSSNIYNYIANAKDYYDGKITDFSQVGIKAIDKNTVQYTLISPTSYFLSVVSNISYLPANRQLLEKSGERFATSKDMLYTSGAYYLNEYEPQNIHEFTYNPAYWGVGEISIAKITETYNKEAASIGVEMFRRGESTTTGLPDAILDDWLNDPARSNFVIPGEPSVSAQNFLFNFALPNIDAQYQPENWLAAVNNKSFRKAIYHGVDRVAAASTINSYNAKEVVSNTIVVKNYIALGGTDYTNLGALEKLSSTEQFNPTLAKEFKAKAMQELSGKVTFPVKVVYAYNTGSVTATNMTQVIKQQLENLLGKDFINVEPVGYAASGFNVEVRDKGKFCLIDTSNGPDARDPSTYLTMFLKPSSSRYGSTHLAKEYAADGGLAKHEVMINKALEERLDVDKRFNLFAEAEAFLINEAMIIPFTCNRYSFNLTYLQPFKGYTSEKGISLYKGRVVLDEQLTKEQYIAAKAEYDKGKAELKSK